MVPVFCAAPDLTWGWLKLLSLESRTSAGEGKPPGKQQVSSFHEGEVVSCPISPDRAKEMRAIGTTDTNDTLLEVPIAKDENGSVNTEDGL